jgi:hypothetical protein
VGRVYAKVVIPAGERQKETRPRNNDRDGCW